MARVIRPAQAEINGRPDDRPYKSPIFMLAAMRPVHEGLIGIPGNNPRTGDGSPYKAVFLPYFLWKRSMRPAVSTSFCLPVKNG